MRKEFRHTEGVPDAKSACEDFAAEGTLSGAKGSSSTYSLEGVPALFLCPEIIDLLIFFSLIVSKFHLNHVMYSIFLSGNGT